MDFVLLLHTSTSLQLEIKAAAGAQVVSDPLKWKLGV